MTAITAPGASCSLVGPTPCHSDTMLSACSYKHVFTAGGHSISQDTRSRAHPFPLRVPMHVFAAGDWLQGPYVYALYEYYGFDVKDIGRLFIAGFGSSMVVGTVVGALADK